VIKREVENFEEEAVVGSESEVESVKV